MTSLKAKTADAHTLAVMTISGALHNLNPDTTQLTVFRTDGLLSFAGLSRSLLLGQNDNRLLLFFLIMIPFSLNLQKLPLSMFNGEFLKVDFIMEYKNLFLNF